MFPFWSFIILFKKLFPSFITKDIESAMDKYLIVGLGNPGDEYHCTRHNVGWMVADAFAKKAGVEYEDKRYGLIAQTMLKGRKIILLKPTTFMNLSGNAVRYWLNKENIDISRLLVIVDDTALKLGKLRLKSNGSSGGHNGLEHIQQLIGDNYARLRIGIGNDFPRGGQINWVLGKFSEEEQTMLLPSINTAVEEIKFFILQGPDLTMNTYNRK